MSFKNKEKRIDLRVTSEQKEILERAADLKGMSLSAYLLSYGLTVAQAEIEAHQKLILSDRDRDLFLKLITSPPEPLPTLKEAMRKFQEKYESNDMADRSIK